MARTAPTVTAPAPPAEVTQEAAVITAVEEYRLVIFRGWKDDLAGFVRDATRDPEGIGAEVVDHASDWLDYDISYDWETPQPLRDAICAAGAGWAATLTVDTLTSPVRALPGPTAGG